jgi:hypothetical protein
MFEQNSYSIVIVIIGISLILLSLIANMIQLIRMYRTEF